MRENHPPKHDWLVAVKVRGLGDALITLLDVVEPVGPLAAQLAWVFVPAARIVGGHTALHDLAEALEDPEANARLRQRLADDDSSTDH